MWTRTLPMLLAAAALAAAAQASAHPHGSRPGYDYGYDNDNDIVVRPWPISPDIDVQSEVVGYADLDLSSPYGAHILLRRLHAAAKNVCSPEPTAPFDLNVTSDYSECMFTAMSQAVADVGAPKVEHLYRYGE